MAGGFFATNLGGMQVLGLEGWRCAFHLVAIVSVTTSVLVMWLAVDPRQKSVVRPCLLKKERHFSQPPRFPIQAMREVPHALCCAIPALRLLGLSSWE